MHQLIISILYDYRNPWDVLSLGCFVMGRFVFVRFVLGRFVFALSTHPPPTKHKGPTPWWLFLIRCTEIQRVRNNRQGFKEQNGAVFIRGLSVKLCISFFF